MGNNDVFAVIADKTRRGILTALKDGERPVGDLVAELGVSQPTVSKHLKILREAGMVSMEAQGQRRLYAVQPEPLAEVTAWIDEIADGAAPVPPALPDPGTEDVSATGHGTEVPDGAGTEAGPGPAAAVPPPPLAPRPERSAGGTTARPDRGTGSRAADILSSLSGLRRRRRPPRR
ncbi:ArsR/SmtB family transcription factor [Kocuria sp. M1N1S27]|uniref:ArsR/SmtB family transcription factor n=1 Tax=Kocuria kalidii TaxID=3376283 RepID=UPI0037AAAB45